MLQTFSQLCGVCRIIFSIFLSFWYWGTPSLCWSFGLLLLKFSILHLPLVGHWISLCPALQPIKVLNAHQRLRQYCTISKLAEGTLYPYIQALDGLKNTNPEMIPGITTNYRLPTGFYSADHDFLRSAIQPVINPSHCPFIQPTFSEPTYEDVILPMRML